MSRRQPTPPEFWGRERPEPRDLVQRWRGQNPRMAAFWRRDLTPEAVASINEQEVGWVVWTRPVPEWDARRCIRCHADVFRTQPESCPHE